MARIQVIVPDELLGRVDAIVQRASRSAWVVAAMEGALSGEKPVKKPVGAIGVGVEQSVAPHELEVEGSSPSPATKSPKAAVRVLVLTALGDRRMTERELAKKLGMHEMKLTKVLRELVADGDLRYDRGLVVAA